MLQTTVRRSPRGVFLLAALVLAALVLAVCVTSCSRPREGLITHVEDPQFSEGELYWRVIDLSPLFADGVEAAADSLIARSPSPQVRRRALLWKINALPVAQNAIFRIDPLIALLHCGRGMPQNRSAYRRDWQRVGWRGHVEPRT